MPALIVRNLPEATHRALKLRAARHGRSTEAEVREILENAVHGEPRLKIGSRLAEFGRRFGGVELNTERDQTPADAAMFE